jgi:phospholipid/cholesterol/gamma-HCH transport system permease protein
MACVVPGYLLTLVTTFFVLSTVVTVFNNEPGGTYNHYFVQFLAPTDLLYSLIKATTYCIAATLIHCYYGYFASGGPQGVGVAAGHAMRATITVVIILNALLTMAMWGVNAGARFGG